MENNYLVLAHAKAHNERISVEELSGLLSQQTGEYHSLHDAQGLLEAMRLQRLLTYCAPTSYCSGSNYPYFMLTKAGYKALDDGMDEHLNKAAHMLWVKSNTE